MSEKSPSFSKEEVERVINEIRNQTLAQVEKIIDKIHKEWGHTKYIKCNKDNCSFRDIKNKIKNLKEVGK